MLAGSAHDGHKKAGLEMGLQTGAYMAERTGLEPATSGVTGQHSNQLNYRSALYCNRTSCAFSPFT